MKVHQIGAAPEEIQNGNWNGRVWTIDKFKFILEINEGSKEFCFVLSIN